MVDQPNFDPSKTSPPLPGSGATPPKTKPHTEFKGSGGSGQGAGKPMHWLGMEFSGEQAKQLWNIISQSISTQIKKEQDRAVKALRKLRSDNPEDQGDDS